MCTRALLKALSGEVVVARTMDFASNTGQKFGEFQAGLKVGNSTTSIPFKAKFSDIGFTVFGKHYGVRTICDGMNKAGLSIETLWLPDTKFNNAMKTPDNGIDGLTLPQLILGTCKNIAEVVKLLDGKQLTLPVEFIDKYATIHLSVSDLSGKTLVVEWNDKDGKAGMPEFYDNPTGVMTNAPKFPWHLTNLNTVAHFQKFNVSSKQDINGQEVKTTGFGNNQYGLPGDATPPSRFIRANVLLNLATDYEQPKDAKAAMLLLDKVMATVSVIKGTSANHGTLSPDYDYTQWTVLKDLKNYKLYQKSANDLGYSELVCDMVKLDADLNAETE